MAVVAPSEPHTEPELMAYTGVIVRVSQDYEGRGWVRYNSAFRHQAALSGNRNWSIINGTLFTMNFSGRSAGTGQHQLCFATSHSERYCTQSGNPDPDVGERLKSLETAASNMAQLKLYYVCRTDRHLANALTGNEINFIKHHTHLKIYSAEI